MTLISVPDMTCGHCRASIESALSAVPDTGEVTVDLPARRVRVAGHATPAVILAALDGIGFPAELLEDAPQR